jgi:hypothetical protein
LENETEVLKFLRTHSIFCRFAKEVVFLKETLQATLYNVKTGASQDEFIVKIPRRTEDKVLLQKSYLGRSYNGMESIN